MVSKLIIGAGSAERFGFCLNLAVDLPAVSGIEPRIAQHKHLTLFGVERGGTVVR